MPRAHRSVSVVLGWLCHLSGTLSAVLLVRFSLSRGLGSPAAMAVLQVAMAVVVGVLIGKIVQECAFALAEGVVTTFGRPFFRKRITITGRLVSEIWLPGGTWIRCETWRKGAACEWTDRDGSCTRIEMPAMTVVRAAPPLRWNSEHAHGPLYDLSPLPTWCVGRLHSDSLKKVDRRWLLNTQAKAPGSAESKGSARSSVLTPP